LSMEQTQQNIKTICSNRFSKLRHEQETLSFDMLN
jgi:hypothetical protein